MSETVSTAAVADDAGRLEEGVRRYERLGWPRPDVVLVSGSGLAVDLGEPEHGPVELQELIPFDIHAVVGHPLQVELFTTSAGHRVLYQRGRLHSYQGYSAAETVFPVRLARLLGARTLVMTNAAGGVDPRLAPGDLVLIEDHVNLTGLNPLRGQLPEAWGPRFPDMVTAYDPELRALARQTAEALSIPLTTGVYAGVAGPSYETPAEVRMLRTLGGHVTGMSTVLEIIAARHMGMRCLTVSLVSNAAAGVTGEPLDHDEVLAAGAAAATNVQRLLAALLADPRIAA
jgi:purine-nucleoside phosphorylase